MVLGGIWVWLLPGWIGLKLEKDFISMENDSQQEEISSKEV
jgi:hypothetical protein